MPTTPITPPSIPPPPQASTLTTPVLIIGGGIVGLSAANFLTHHSIPSILIERQPHTTIHPRARSVNARTMEIYRHLGIQDLVIAAGRDLNIAFGMYEGGSFYDVIGGLRRKDVGEGQKGDGEEKEKENPKIPIIDGIRESLGPVQGTFITQSKLEPVLLSVALERNAPDSIRYNTTCLSITQDSQGVTATLLDRHTNTQFNIQAQYLIAADGASSPIRKALDIPFSTDYTLGCLMNILFEADLGDFVKGRQFSICRVKMSGKEGEEEEEEIDGIFTAIDNQSTWVFHLLYYPERGQKAEDFTMQRCKEIVVRALGFPAKLEGATRSEESESLGNEEWKDDLDVNIISIMPWKAAVKTASRFTSGRVFLAGDAAHAMPPWAGQGANTGVADVWNLAWKLAWVLRWEEQMKGSGKDNDGDKNSGEKLLKSYDEERIPVAISASAASAAAADEKGLVQTKKSISWFIGILKRLALMTGHGFGYEGSGGVGGSLICEEDTKPLGGLSWRPWSVASLMYCLDGRPGRRVPHLWVKMEGIRDGRDAGNKNGDVVNGEKEKEKRISTLDLCGKNFVLLTGAKGEEWKDIAKIVSDALGVRIDVYVVGGNKGDLRCEGDGDWERMAGITNRGAVLVRPDDVVCWRGRRGVGGEERRGELERAVRRAVAGVCL